MLRDITAFLLRSALFLGVVAMLLLLNVVLGPPLEDEDYMAAIARKEERLRTLPGPRVVIIGGSNAAFGLDGQRIEEVFHRPVVNMALHAGLGFEFMVNEVADELHPGDVVIAFPEHVLYSAPRRSEYPLLSAMDFQPSALRSVPVRQWWFCSFHYAWLKLQATRNSLHRDTVPPGRPCYRKEAFDERGDVIAHLDRPAPDVKSPGVQVRSDLRVDPRFWTLSDRLLEAGRNAGATVAFGWPGFARSSDNADVDRLLDRELRAHVPFVIGHPQDHVYPDSLFFDTEYHLGRAGRALRTERLLEEARAILPDTLFQAP